jgi:hypothetical protein
MDLLESLKSVFSASRGILMENEKTRLKILLDLFKEIRSIYLRNVEFVEYQAYDFFPCWIIGTYIFDDFESFPYVYINSPKRSGKTKTLLLTSKLAKNSINSVNISQASVYRIIEEKKPTLFIDEADYLSSEEKAELYKILNAGYKKGSYVYRCENVGKKIETREWNVYSPKMLASVDEMKEQFIDRCITFHLLRSRNKEISNSVIKENVDDKGIKWEFYRNGLEQYAIKLKEEILKNFDEIDSDERMEEIIGRDRELWLPILAIGKTLSSEIYANLINLALDKVARTKEQEKETIENAVIGVLLNIVSKDDWFPVKDIHTELKLKPEYSEWLNIRSVGKVMKRLNFQLRKTNIGSFYYIKKQDLEELAKRYGVEVDKKE